ncbi:unnamed protein product [Linum tenue]|uniref:SWIM-type domain-containing protein n=1 Tax=Linum tenue TaxID=586396 RepID=A0AAV0KVL7_9ROSI|nr:unnamed protein product [Linum tenue]
MKELAIVDKKSKKCIPRASTDNLVEVRLQSTGFVVDLGIHSCTCGYWDLSGIPCIHALSAIAHSRLHVEDFVHHYYHVSTVRKAYAEGIPCLVGSQAWPNAEGYLIHPQITRAMPGRPKKKRSQ